MNFKKIVLLLCFGFPIILSSQLETPGISHEKLVVKKDTFGYYHYSPLKSILPNRPIFIVIDDFDNIIKSRILEEHKRMNTLEDWHLVYIQIPKETIDFKTISLLMEELFYNYFYDRNRVFLSTRIDVEAEDLKEQEDFLANIAALWVTSNSDWILRNGNTNVFPISAENPPEPNKTMRSKTVYEAVPLKEMKSLKKYKKKIDEYEIIKGRHNITLTNGYFQVGQGKAVDFDEETLVDLRTFNSLWTLSYDYMFTERLGLGLSIGFIAKKDGSPETVINESISGGTVIKLGISTRYLAYTSRRVHLYPEFSIGNLSSNIGGGSASFQTTQSGTVLDIEQSGKRSQKSIFVDLKLGADFRLGKNLFLRGNISHSQANFNENFGSISGFSGTGINLGIGCVF